LLKFVLAIGVRVSVVKTRIFVQSVQGISVELSILFGLVVWAWDFAMVRVGEEGCNCVRISRAFFCKMDVISEFAASLKDSGEISYLEFGLLAAKKCCNIWLHPWMNNVE